MLTTSRKILKTRGQKVLDSLQKKTIKDLGILLVDSEVEAGSGSLPDDKIESASLSFSPKNGKAKDLAKAFRCGSIPVVGYIHKNTFYIDLKSVLPNQIKRLSTVIQEV
jgi:L-seryl-tRNA(Ser) seleniumtransferase